MPINSGKHRRDRHLPHGTLAFQHFHGYQVTHLHVQQLAEFGGQDQTLARQLEESQLIVEQTLQLALGWQTQDRHPSGMMPKTHAHRHRGKARRE